jgi:hypothetical protein
MLRNEEIHPSPPLEKEEIPSRFPLLVKGDRVRRSNGSVEKNGAG